MTGLQANSGAGALSVLSIWLSLRYLQLVPAAIHEVKQHKLQLLWHWVNLIAPPALDACQRVCAEVAMWMTALLRSQSTQTSVPLQCRFGSRLPRKFTRFRYYGERLAGPTTHACRVARYRGRRQCGCTGVDARHTRSHYDITNCLPCQFDGASTARSGFLINSKD